MRLQWAPISNSQGLLLAKVWSLAQVVPMLHQCRVKCVPKELWETSFRLEWHSNLCWKLWKYIKTWQFCCSWLFKGPTTMTGQIWRFSSSSSSAHGQLWYFIFSFPNFPRQHSSLHDIRVIHACYKKICMTLLLPCRGTSTVTATKRLPKIMFYSQKLQCCCQL